MVVYTFRTNLKNIINFHIIHTYNIEIYKLLKNGPKSKNYTIFERGDHAESKYVIRNKF